MILLVDLCYQEDSLSAYEFVRPIADALARAGAGVECRHYTRVTPESASECEGVVLCGTALKDNGYAEHIELFSWLQDPGVPALGICAGMQVMASLFGGRIIPHPAIGLEDISVVEDSSLLGPPRQIQGYHLHNYGVTLPPGFRLLAGTAEAVEAFRHPDRPLYGILFHPEVRNRWVLERFLDL
ncbi:MAG: hypothetical protein GKC10_03815 [Methanosarcinales archaeon]|nr:hypothetical protein [Methanosarcinales archaeon]